MIALEILKEPQTWVTIIASIIVIGWKTIEKLWVGNERRADRKEANKDSVIVELRNEILGLKNKIADLTQLNMDIRNEMHAQEREHAKEIHAQNLRIQEITQRSEQNKQILSIIKKWMEDPTQTPHFLDLL